MVSFHILNLDWMKIIPFCKLYMAPAPQESESILKGQCHDINNFFEGLKNQNSNFCIGALIVFKFFCIFNVLKSTFQVPACFYENTCYFIFTGSCIRISSAPPPQTRLRATQRELTASIQPLKMPTVNHPSVKKSNTITRFKIISGLRNSLKSNRWVPVCRNKQFEEGYWKDFHN